MNADELQKERKLCEECKIVKLFNNDGELTFSGHIFIEKALTGWPVALEEIERLSILNDKYQKVAEEAAALGKKQAIEYDAELEQLQKENESLNKQVMISQGFIATLQNQENQTEWDRLTKGLITTELTKSEIQEILSIIFFHLNTTIGMSFEDRYLTERAYAKLSQNLKESEATK